MVMINCWLIESFFYVSTYHIFLDIVAFSSPYFRRLNLCLIHVYNISIYYFDVSQKLNILVCMFNLNFFIAMNEFMKKYFAGVHGLVPTKPTLRKPLEGKVSDSRLVKK